MLSLLQNTQKIAHIDLKVLKYNVFVIIFYKKHMFPLQPYLKKTVKTASNLFQS